MVMETIEKIKKTYYDETEECFIDELIFCKIETLSKFLNKFSTRFSG